MKRYLTSFFIIIMALGLTGCKYFHSSPSIIRALELDMTPPPGPEIYQKGWLDGCESGYKGYASSFAKIFSEYKQDPELASNKIYYQIWKDAYMYCSNYAMMSDEHGLGNWR